MKSTVQMSRTSNYAVLQNGYGQCSRDSRHILIFTTFIDIFLPKNENYLRPVIEEIRIRFFQYNIQSVFIETLS